MQLCDFNALTFDCYGTLIDWESSIVTALQPLAGGVSDGPLESLFRRHQTRLDSP